MLQLFVQESYANLEAYNLFMKWENMSNQVSIPSVMKLC